MRRIGMSVMTMVLVVAAALPATAAKPVAYDEITATVDGVGSLTLTASAVDGVGTVSLSGTASLMVDCLGTGLIEDVAWNATDVPATFDLHPNGSSGTITVDSADLPATDCLGNPVSGNSLVFSFDTDPGADRYRDVDGRVVSRTGTGTLTYGVLDAAAVTVDAVRSYR